MQNGKYPMGGNVITLKTADKERFVTFSARIPLSLRLRFKTAAIQRNVSVAKLTSEVMECWLKSGLGRND